MRDGDKAKVYAAEGIVQGMLDRGGVVQIHGSTLVLEPETRFGNLDAVRTFVAGVQASPWYRERYPDAEPLTVRQRRGAMRGHYEPDTSTIALHDNERVGVAFAMRALYVLHEMAHHVTRDHHGPDFRREYVEHVRQVIGETVAFILTDAFREVRETSST